MRRPPGTAELFRGFLSVGIVGFGGVLPFLRRMVVERRRWLDAAEFTDMLALAQLLPGPNVTNFAVFLGARYRGLAGATAAAVGLIGAPFCIVLSLGLLLRRLDTYPVVIHALGGMAAGASGLVLANAIRIGMPLRGRKLGLAVAALAFVAVALLRLPLVPVLLVGAPLSVALHLHAGRLRGQSGGHAR